MARKKLKATGKVAKGLVRIGNVTTNQLEDVPKDQWESGQEMLKRLGWALEKDIPEADREKLPEPVHV